MSLDAEFLIIPVSVIDELEGLALFEIERRLHATISDLVEAFNRSESRVSDDEPEFNPLVDDRR